MWPFADTQRISKLEERFEKLERDLKAAYLDWDDVYAKCRKLLGRTVKERANLERIEEAPEETGPQLAEPAAQPGRLLTARQMQLQQTILRRRAGG